MGYGKGREGGCGGRVFVLGVFFFFCMMCDVCFHLSSLLFYV